MIQQTQSSKILTVLGPRGSGKTTLLRKLTSAEYGGVPVTNNEQERIGECFELRVKGNYAKHEYQMILLLNNNEVGSIESFAKFDF